MNTLKLNIGGLQVEAVNMGETLPTFAVKVGHTDRGLVAGVYQYRAADFFMDKLFYGLCDGLKVQPQDASFFVTVFWDDPSAEKDDDYDFFLVSFVEDDDLRSRLEVTLDEAIARGPLTLYDLLAQHDRLRAQA